MIALISIFCIDNSLFFITCALTISLLNTLNYFSVCLLLLAFALSNILNYNNFKKPIELQK
jgi:hypothetical protein